jgi:hypothetical protein
MKRALIGASVALACLTGASASFAAPGDPKLALAERLVTVLQLDASYRSMVGQASVGLAQQAGIRPQDQAQQQAIIASLDGAITQATADAKPRLAAAVAQVYTVEELKAAVAFFESPAGHGFNSKYAQYEAALGQTGRPTLSKVIGPWEASYCQKTQCTAADHEAFAKMRQALQTGAATAPAPKQ